MRTQIYAVPQTFFVDGSGKIVHSVLGARTLEQFDSLTRQYLK